MILCFSSTQKDVRLPIASISPDFVSRRRNFNPGLIRREKSPYCTVFPQFPGFHVHRNCLVFYKSPKMNSFNKKARFAMLGVSCREVLPKVFSSDGGWYRAVSREQVVPHGSGIWRSGPGFFYKSFRPQRSSGIFHHENFSKKPLEKIFKISHPIRTAHIPAG